MKNLRLIIALLFIGIVAIGYAQDDKRKEAKDPAAMAMPTKGSLPPKEAPQGLKAAATRNQGNASQAPQQAAKGTKEGASAPSATPASSPQVTRTGNASTSGAGASGATQTQVSKRGANAARGAKKNE